MSWFTEISEKAENILNTIDKNAAKAFNKHSTKSVDVCPQTTDAPSCHVENEILASNSTNSLDQIKLNLYSSFDDERPLLANQSPTKSNYKDKVSNSKRDKNSEFLQNEMLQNEIHSLNNEITLLLNRIKIAEQKSNEVNEKLVQAEKKNVELEQEISKLITEKLSFEEISSICEKLPNVRSNLSNLSTKNENHGPLHEHYASQVQELLQDKTNLATELRNKEDEIMMLKSRLSQKTYCFSADELQSRLRALTITLVQKQSSLESLTSEKNALAIKLNQLQKRYDEVLGILHESRINLNDTDDAKARGPPYRSSRKISYRIRQIISSLNYMGCRTNFSYQKLLVSNFLVVIYLISMHILIFVLIFVRMPGETAETENVPHSS